MIQLAYPIGLAALAAIPLLLVLHLLRPRRRRVVLSSIALWQAALRDRQGAGGLRRLPRSLSLALLLATAALLGCALAGPQWLADRAAGTDLVLVLDTSASMKTRSGSGTRFDQALAEAATMVERMPRAGRVLVMTSGRKAALKSGFEADRGVLRQVLRSLRAGDEAGQPREALSLALSLIAARDDARVYFFTDGAFDRAEDPQSPQIVYRLVGGPARNVAITRFDLRQEPASDERFQVLLTVRNYTDAAVSVPASAELEGRVLFERAVELPAHASRTLVLTFPGQALGRAVARIRADDDLAADNTAYAAVNGLEPLRVLLVSPGNFFLRSLLQALPGVILSERSSLTPAALPQSVDANDIVVFDRVAPPPLPAGSYLLVDTLAPGLPFEQTGTLLRAPRIAGASSSALMQDVDMSPVRIEAARRIVLDETRPGLQRLFWSRETDLALALIDGERRVLYLGFDLARSNFPLQAAFPLFMRQGLDWLHPRAEPLSAQIPAGAMHRLRSAAGEQVVVELPSGGMQTLAGSDGEARFAPTEAGIYRYSLHGRSHYLAVNLTDARESDVSRRLPPRAELPVEAGPAAVQSLLPLWPYLLAAALALLALEWWVWSRSPGRA